MTLDMLKQTYREQLVKAGVEPQRAMKAAEVVTKEELDLIREIWTEWADALGLSDSERADQSVGLVDILR